MPRYNELRFLAFRISPDLHELNYQFYMLSFPEVWKGILYELAQETVRSSRKKIRIPIRVLNSTLMVLIPDLISIARNADRNDKRPWLYCKTPVDSKKLLLIVKRWIHVAFANAPEASRQRVIDNLAYDDLQWEETTINLAAWERHANGTANAKYNDSYNLLPDFIASKFSKPEIKIDFGGEQLTFRRAPLTVGSSGAELIS